MKGLFIKDMLLLKAYKKNFITSIVIYSFIIYLNIKQSNMVLIGSCMIMFLFSVYAISTFNYDEKSNSNRYILALPLTKRDVIKSKYFLAILSVIFGFIIGTVISFILSSFANEKFPNLISYFEMILGSFLALGFIQSIQIPFIYKFGAEKGRLQIYIIMFILFAIIGFLSYFIKDISFLNFNISSNIIVILLFLFTILEYFISYKVSCKIYNKKDM